MNTAIIAVASALSLIGVGTTTVAMTGGMMGDHPMMGDGGMMGGGMHDGGPHNSTDYEHHDCHCCGDEGGGTEEGLSQLSLGR